MIKLKNIILSFIVYTLFTLSVNSAELKDLASKFKPASFYIQGATFKIEPLDARWFQGSKYSSGNVERFEDKDHHGLVIGANFKITEKFSFETDYTWARHDIKAFTGETGAPCNSSNYPECSLELSQFTTARIVYDFLNPFHISLGAATALINSRVDSGALGGSTFHFQPHNDYFIGPAGSIGFKMDLPNHDFKIKADYLRAKFDDRFLNDSVSSGTKGVKVDEIYYEQFRIGISKDL
tara:strand:+ start:260 stop:973 length:714 start_codon:yes stop_codon:yes gene_type:complete